MKWTELHSGGLFSILSEVTNGDGVKEEVTGWRDKEKLLKELVEVASEFHYSRRLRDYGDCAILKDGSVLACLTFADFAGTFASHDDINVEWWIGK